MSVNVLTLVFCFIFFTVQSFSNEFCNANLNNENETETETVTDFLLPEINGENFYYFGYGSNLLASRIHIQNPTAIKVGPAKLKNYRLDFNGFTKRWNGAPATIVPDQNATTYGTLWTIQLNQLQNIDNQEGVNKGIYEPRSVVVMLNNSTRIAARTYLLVKQPTTTIASYKNDIPLDRKPSKTYLQCLVKGAEETGLPEEYIHWMRSIQHNNQTNPELETLLELKDVPLLN